MPGLDRADALVSIVVFRGGSQSRGCVRYAGGQLSGDVIQLAKRGRWPQRAPWIHSARRLCYFECFFTRLR